MKRVIDNIDIFPTRLAEAIGNAHVFNIEFERNDILSVPTLKKYLTGAKYPDALTLARIATYLDTSTDFLLGLSSVKTLPGRWIVVDDKSCVCSNCGCPGKNTYRYCPTCGKEMNLEWTT